jgi:hypothetical protein
MEEPVFTLLRRLHDEVVRQPEVHNRLGRYIDIPVAGQSSDRGSSATTSQTSNRHSRSAGGQATDQHAQSSTSADQCR